MSRRIWFGIWAIVALSSFVFQFDAFADNIAVNTTTDEYGAGAGCALREAVEAANTNADFGGCTRSAAAGVDMISIPAGTYTLDLGAVGDNANTEGDLDITGSVTINGAGAASTIIRNGYGAGGTLGDGDRIFHIDPGAVVGAIDVTITGVTLRDADLGCSAAACVFGGATIYKESTGFLTIQNSFLLDNNSSCDVANCGSDQDNTAVIHAENDGDITLRSVTISDNTASCSADGCAAGNVVLRMNGNSGDLTIENSTITDNVGTCSNIGCEVGELIHDEVGAGALTIRSTIINDNTITCDGDDCNISELLEFDDLDTVTINNLTVDGNELSCTGDECDTDEMISGINVGVFNFSNSQVSNNEQSCVGTECETESLIAGFFSGSVNFTNLRVSDNSLFCGGQFCAVGLDAMIDLSPTGGTTLTDTRIVDNDLSCEGTRCFIALRLWVGDDYTIERSTMARNTANCLGDDCFVDANALLESFFGTSRIIDSTFDRNSATCASTDCVALVAGMVIAGSEETVVRRSTISNNVNACEDTGACGSFTGGGVVIFCGCGGTVRFINSTISGNTTTGDGGGILHVDGFVHMNNVTIADNVADSDNNGIGEGGGIFNDGASEPFRIRNTLIARNQDPTSDPDCFGTLISQGYNLIGSLTANCSLVGNMTGNVINASPRIGPLADNGGATFTHALLPGSPALDAANNLTCVTEDQRRVSRPLGIICDIGAYEAGLNVGGDPPIWNDIMVFPTPERALGQDLNGNGYIGDTVLRYHNLATGEIVNTGLAVSNRHRDVDLYENTIVFVEQTNYPMGVVFAYDIVTKELTNTGVLGYRPTIYGDIISVSGSTIRYFDLSKHRLIETGIPGEAQAIWDGVIAYHRTTDSRFHSTVRYYDVRTGEVVNTKVAGEFPVIYENIIAFTTNESLIAEDLNGDGDLRDSILRYYDLKTKQVVNTGQVGRHPAIYGNHIVFSQGRQVRYYDIETGQTFDTGFMGAEPDIFGNTITYYVWEDWTGDDLNVDGDSHDPIIGTFEIPEELPERTLILDETVSTTVPNASPQPLVISQALSYPNPASFGQAIQFQVQGDGIEAIQVEVYNLAGQLVFQSDWATGNRLSWHQLNNEGNPVANGVYLYVVTASGNNSQARSTVQKLVVLR
jgi:CSLREA domain-containing protein